MTVVLYLLILVFVDNFLLQGLQSPEELLKWLSQVLRDPNLKVVTSDSSSLLKNFPTWFDSLIWLFITLILAVFKRKFILVPLVIYTTWITFWVVVAVIVLSINLWNPNSGAPVLLLDALFVWISNVIVFAVWYWIIDHKNHELFNHSKKHAVHFMFPQSFGTLPGWEKWTPGFVDYIFLSFNTSTAFGAADAVSLTKKSKLLVILQAFLSLVLFAMIAARAINIIRQ